jgi:methylenetetrahydrofolate reductase (NADPH)
MKPDSKLANKLEGKDFIVTAECLTPTGTNGSIFQACAKTLNNKITAVNAPDNHFRVAMSSMAAATGLLKSGIEPIYQVVTRDRNRIALESDLLGAAFLGIKNVLCLSGYHQTLMGNPEAANVYDIDSIQLIAMVNKMNEGVLLDGSKIDGSFSMLIGAVANPNMKPLELNILRLKKKINAGAKFIQTQAVFDTDVFQQWLEAAVKAGLTERAGILAGVLPLTDAAETKKLSESFTDYVIPKDIIERLNSTSDQASQNKEGLAICTEIVKKLKLMKGLRGIHILSGGNESIVPELISATAL